jgi:hypothetical protein
VPQVLVGERSKCQINSPSSHFPLSISLLTVSHLLSTLPRTVLSTPFSSSTTLIRKLLTPRSSGMAVFPPAQTATPSPKPFKQVATGDSIGLKAAITRPYLSPKLPALPLSPRTQVAFEQTIRVKQLPLARLEAQSLPLWPRAQQLLSQCLRVLMRAKSRRLLRQPFTLLRLLRFIQLLLPSALRPQLPPVLLMTMCANCKG